MTRGNRSKVSRASSRNVRPARPLPAPGLSLSPTNRPVQRIPGHNVDRIDVAAGLRELKACGYESAETEMVIEHALMRWARGEEEAAQRGAIDRSFHGINLTSWIRVLAAARAHAESAAKEQC